MADKTTVSFHLQALSKLRTNRSHFEAQWEEAAERLIPAHKHTFRTRGSGAAESRKGLKNQEKMLDSTAALALQRFISVMESLVFPQNTLWHRLTALDDQLRKNRQVRKYFDKINAILFRHRYRPAANFVGQSQKTLMGYGAYGNGLLFVDEEPIKGPGLRYKSLHLGETYLIENHQGVVDTFYRVYDLTYMQIDKEFSGNGQVPESIAKKAKSPNEAQVMTQVLHVVKPREDYAPGRVDSGGLAWESLHILLDTEDVVRESGYSTFPLGVARYIQYVNEIYGRGPAQTVLPAIKVLNEEKKVMIKQGHRIVDPVLLTHDDGKIGTVSLKPGAVNAGGVNSQGRALVQPLPTGNPVVGKDMMDDERQVINDAFLITLFQILIDTPRMTATEVLERAREKGMLVAPTAGALSATFLGPTIERELDVLFRQALLPPPPPILAEAGGEFQVEYDNPISRMARAENAAGFMRSLDTALQFAQVTQDLGPLDWFNFDKAMPAILDINGAPVEWTRTLDQVTLVRQQRQAQAQQQQLIEAAPAISGVMQAAANAER